MCEPSPSVTDRLHSDGDKAVVGVSTNAFRRELRVCDRLLEEVSRALSHSSGWMDGWSV